MLESSALEDGSFTWLAVIALLVALSTLYTLYFRPHSHSSNKLHQQPMFNVEIDTTLFVANNNNKDKDKDMVEDAKTEGLSLPATLTLQSLTDLTQLKQASILCAAAFLEASSYGYIYQITDKTARQSAYEWLFYRNACINSELDPNSCLGLVDTKGQVVCFFMLVAPSTPDMTLWQKIRHGFLLLPLKWGLATVARLEAYVNWTEIVYADLHRQHAHQYYKLERMVVAPAWQGHRIGSVCLETALRQIVDAQELPCVLGTQLESNVRFYTRLGFVNADRHSKYTRKFDSKQFFMARKPQPKQQ